MSIGRKGIFFQLEFGDIYGLTRSTILKSRQGVKGISLSLMSHEACQSWLQASRTKQVVRTTAESLLIGMCSPESVQD